MTEEVNEIGHEHPDVQGGWLRPAVFGAMDGLVSNFALIVGVLAASSGTDQGIVAGLAGLAAGAFSMAVGEYASVASQAEFAHAQVAIERHEIVRNHEAERGELVEMLEEYGIEPETAQQAARQMHRNPDHALRFHTLVELGFEPGQYPSPWTAAIASLLSFATGALVPLLPLLLGFATAWPTVIVSLGALFICGAIVTRITSRSWWFGGLRQLVLGGAAAGLTYLVGEAVGSQFG
jgi:VIT1/CCC1 family predicted Fe2+/Mn2+ transporter